MLSGLMLLFDTELSDSSVKNELRAGFMDESQKLDLAFGDMFKQNHILGAHGMLHCPSTDPVL